jgi:hypothetical protein
VLPFPFVVGCGRSGTTLVRAMLDAHPALAVPAESHFVVPIALRRRLLDRYPHLVADEIVASEGFRRWGLPEAPARERVRGTATAADAVRAVYSLHAELEGKSRYADKTPSYVLHVALLAAFLPEARFLHVIRDGRDVALSIREVEWGTPSLEGAALIWKGCIDAGRRAGRLIGPARYRELRYEDLLADPSDALRDVCAFFALEFDPAMLRYHERAAATIAGSRVGAEHRNLHRPLTAGLRDWRTQMDAREVELFQAAVGGTLDALGYPLTGSARRRARAAASA